MDHHAVRSSGCVSPEHEADWFRTVTAFPSKEVKLSSLSERAMLKPHEEEMDVFTTPMKERTAFPLDTMVEESWLMSDVSQNKAFDILRKDLKPGGDDTHVLPEADLAPDKGKEDGGRARAACHMSRDVTPRSGDACGDLTVALLFLTCGRAGASPPLRVIGAAGR
ncbi:hypothetical protein AAFF_G00048940 [Aldrovandia affinis]|uniref:Uncharacterized protein n=1 Tax=Aldrovandia affinis TaxID=143900 RepID=A0AAD7S147_9TELE|nr:hypothetical protein AAFF_G00048940 [Aldrovandia affinis]